MMSESWVPLFEVSMVLKWEANLFEVNILSFNSLIWVVCCGTDTAVLTRGEVTHLEKGKIGIFIRQLLS
jgi:hypothetical protein